MNVGQRIREAREDLGMPQTVLARRVGVNRNTIGRYESGEHEPSFAMLESIARELRTEPAEFLREPVPLAEAPREAGPEERRRPTLDQVREVFAPLADGLNRYCARWEEKLPTLQGTREEVADFVADSQDFHGFFTRVAAEELQAIAVVLDLANRYVGERELPHDIAVGFTQGEMYEHSLMHKALQRYYAVGDALAESIKDEEAAESTREVLAEARSLSTV